jgi:hypothetical protein
MKRPLEPPSREWEDNIRLDLWEIVCGVVGWMHVARDKDKSRVFVNAVINLRDPYKAGYFLTS